MIVKIGANPEDKSVVQNLLQGVETNVRVLRNKLNMLSIEHPMALEVAQVEKEKQDLTEEVIQRNDEITKLKEINSMLQQKIDSHVCTIVVQDDSEDPMDKLTRVMNELHIYENEMNKIQRDYKSALKVIKSIERELAMYKENADKCRNDFQVASQEIKELKEKVKGNMSLIQAK